MKETVKIKITLDGEDKEFTISGEAEVDYPLAFWSEVVGQTANQFLDFLRLKGKIK